MSERGWAIVTGGSGGIGRAFAEQLSDAGYPVLLIARGAVALQRISADLVAGGGRAAICVADLTTSSGVAAALGAIAELPDVEMLVNSAGFATYGRFGALDPRREAEEIALNIGAVVSITRAVLPRLMARRSGTILNLASVLGLMPTPYFATYAASKAFVLHFSEALAVEARGTGVQVVAVCPGWVATDFAGASGFERALGKMPRVAATDVVRAALNGARRGRVVVVVGWFYRVLALLERFTPRFAMRWILGRLFSPAGSPT